VEFGFNFLDNTTDPWEGHSGHGTSRPWSSTYYSR
jgi:hypothetical protein